MKYKNEEVNMKKRIIAICLATFMAASTLAGCGKIDSSAAAITLANGETIDMGYVYYRVRAVQAMYDSLYLSYAGEDMYSQDMYGNGTTLETQLISESVSAVEEAYVCRLHASEYGAELTDEDNAKISAAVDTFFAENSKETIKALGATRDYVKRMLEDETIVYRVKKAVRDASDYTVTDAEAEMGTFTYAVFSTSSATDANGNAIEVTDEYVSEQFDKAVELAKVDAADFEDKANESGAHVTSHSFSIADAFSDYLGEAVINEAKKLSDGQVSSVVATDDAYYVLRMDKKSDPDASANRKKTLEESNKDNAYNEAVEAWNTECGFETHSDELSKIDIRHDHFVMTVPETEEQQ